MSRIGKKDILIPEGVKLSLDGQEITATGSLGSLKVKFNNYVNVILNDNSVTVSRFNDDSPSSYWGLYRSKIQNIVTGVKDGFKKVLEVNGVGYKAQLRGKMLILSLGYSHDIYYVIPDSVEVKCNQNLIELFSADKELLGQVAAEIRSQRKPEPYKGKGIKYQEEVIIRKEGKKK